MPFRNHSETLANLKDALTPGQLLIDATVPLAAAVGGKATRMLGVWQGSAAEQALEMVPEGVRVVSALHTVSAASLTDLENPLAQDVLLCGDSREDKREAANVIERIDGLRCVDCGRLEMARITESLTALLIAVNARYKAHAGIRLTGLPDPSWRSATAIPCSPEGPAGPVSYGNGDRPTAGMVTVTCDAGDDTRILAHTSHRTRIPCPLVGHRIDERGWGSKTTPRGHERPARARRRCAASTSATATSPGVCGARACSPRTDATAAWSS